jgi:hypothetical protein
MIPVRRVRVIRAETVGSSCVFNLVAGAFVGNLDDAAIRAAVPADGTAMLPVAPSSDPEGEGHYAFVANLPDGSHRRLDWEAFEGIATALAGHEPFETDGLFFTVLRVSRAGRRWFGRWPRGIKAEDGVYRLRSGRRYELQVYCFSPKSVPPGAKLVAETEDDFLAFATPRSIAIDSRYDIKRILFSTEANVAARAAGLRLSLARRDGGTQVELSRDISVQFTFGGTWLLGLGRAAAITIGTAGPALVGVNAAGKFSLPIAIVMIALGAVAGLGSVFLTLRKP